MTEKNERVSDTEVQERENGLYQRGSMKREGEGKRREEEKAETGRKKMYVLLNLETDRSGTAQRMARPCCKGTIHGIMDSCVLFVCILEP
jgi:hypothetical protein